MHDRLKRLAALLTVVVACVLVGGGAAQAAPPTASEGGGGATCELPKPVDDDTISILGRICDRRDTPQSPVPDASISVEDSSGNKLGEATSGADGTFVVDLPGASINHLGKTYTVKIAEDSLPEGTAPEVLTRKVTVNLDTDQSVTFPVGAEQGGTGTATQALQLIVSGLVFSVVLAMGALGLSMVFGTTGLTNFSHGELITFGAIVAFAVDRLPGSITIGGANVTVVIAIFVAFVAGGAFGWLNDAALWRPLRRRGTGLIAMMIVSIGLSIFLRNVYQYFSGAASHNYSQYSSVEPWEIGPILFTPKDLVVILVGMAVLVVTTSLLQFTRIGKATRAVADNPALSSATGINIERVIGLVWIAGTALASLSGALIGVTQGFDYQVGFKLLLLVFAAVILGGLGTIWGAIVGAFIVGLFTELSTLFVPAEFKYVGALLVLILVLLVRPQGLLGRAQRIG